jgi:hypothetical protein
MRTKDVLLFMFARRFLIPILLLVSLPLVAAPKKSAKPAPKDASTAAPSARLRVWKTDFSSKRAVRLTVRPTGKSGVSADLGEFAAESRFGDYGPAPSGDCTLEVRALGDGGALLTTFAIRLPGDGWTTLVLRETEAGDFTFELLDDKPSGDDASAELVVRNFVPSLQTLQFDAGPDLHVRLVTPGCFIHLRGLPRRSLEVKTNAEDGAGNQTNWTNEVDLRQIRRATLLIVADRTGRIRPRVVVDAPAGETR